MPARAIPNHPAGRREFYPLFICAWLLCAVFYFLQYALRSAPGVMVPELTSAWNLSALGLSSLLGLYYYTYAGFSIIAGASLDRYGARSSIPAGIACLAVGAALFGLGSVGAAQVGRLLQGAGSAFAFVGAVYLAAHGFPARLLATTVGATQMFGMLGGAGGQFVVSPLIHGSISWQHFWLAAGAVAAVLAVVTLVATPREPERMPAGRGTIGQMFAPYKVVLSNPQSYLCGACAGLLFLPTTIGDMIWGVSMLQNGFGVDHAVAVNRAAMVPLGWVFGAPLLGYVADRLGRRKPVLIASAIAMLALAAAILFLPPGVMPVYLGGLMFGFVSGAAMIPYSIIKEVNPDGVKGSATGAMNFLVFTLSALAAPVAGWVLQQRAGGAPLDLQDFQQWGWYGLAGIAVAIVLALFLKETGSNARPPAIRPFLVPA
ncbi:MAG: transporter [Nevskia sp.]|nr:transporter [Nevskia sp.]